MEQDLLFVLGAGVLVFMPVTSEQREWFFSGHGRAGVEHTLDRDRLAHHRCARALEDVGDLAAQVLDRESDPERRSEALGYGHGALSPTGIVGQALE